MKANPEYKHSRVNRYTVRRRWYGKPVVYDHLQEKVVPRSRHIWNWYAAEELRIQLGTLWLAESGTSWRSGR